MRRETLPNKQSGAYEPGRWRVNPLNRSSDVVNGNFPTVVRLRDITLRTLEHVSGTPSSDERRETFLSEVVATCVPEIHTSTFGQGHTLEWMRAEVQTVKRINPLCLVWHGGARTSDDVKLAADAGYDGVQFWNVAGGSESIERVCELISAGAQFGIKVSAGINRLTHAGEEYIRDYSKAVREAGGYEIALYDSPGGVGPEAFAYLVGMIKEAAEGCIVAVHAHDSFGLAIANSIASARAGADVIEVAVNGFCTGSGNADLACVATALTVLYGVETGIDLATLTQLARLGEAFSGDQVAQNFPVTGKDVFNFTGTESQIRELSALGLDPLKHWPIDPALVGNKGKWTIAGPSH